MGGTSGTAGVVGRVDSGVSKVEAELSLIESVGNRGLSGGIARTVGVFED